MFISVRKNNIVIESRSRNDCLEIAIVGLNTVDDKQTERKRESERIKQMNSCCHLIYRRACGALNTGMEPWDK